MPKEPTMCIATFGIVADNSIFPRVEYFLVKEKIWKSWVNKSGGIVIKYNKRTGCLGRLEEYKVSFKELCQKV